MKHSFHQLALGLAALTLSVMAWALPAPKDIEAAVNAGQFSKAESLLREVILAKPQSAKAHYELGEVLARESHYQEALQELDQSKALDPTLKFASDPQKFHAVYDKISQLASTTTRTQVSSSTAVSTPVVAPPASPQGLPSWIWVLAGALGLGGLFYFLNKRKPTAPTGYAADQGMGPVQAPRGFGAQYAPAGAPAYPPAPSPGSSPIAGAVIGGLAGVAAGYALSKAFEGEHHQVADQPHPSNNYDVSDVKPQAPDLGSFDAGSGGDNWDNNSSGGNSDDSW
jgi:hypothetical protein